jgi:hypothetical protein
MKARLGPTVATYCLLSLAGSVPFMLPESLDTIDAPQARPQPYRPAQAHRHLPTTAPDAEPVAETPVAAAPERSRAAVTHPVRERP